MAWISVHLEVDGPKLRRLAKLLNTSKAEALGILNYLWFWGINNADENGRVLDADRKDVEDALNGVSSTDAAAVVDALLDGGWLEELDGEIFIHDWATWQKQWYKALQRRKQDTARKSIARKEHAESGGQKMTVAPPRNAKNPEPQKESEASTTQVTMWGQEPEQKKSRYNVPFEEFWKEYPRKDDKAMAYEKYQARIKDGFSDEELLTAAKAYAAQCKTYRTEKRFIKQGKTFLSDKLSFLDYLPKRETKPEKPQDENPFLGWEAEGL